MKKLFYLLFLLPLAFLASCNSDDDLPQVTLTLTAGNVYQAEPNGSFYYVESEDTPIIIEGLAATSLIDGKNAAVTNVFYTINGLPLPIEKETEESPAKLVIPADYMIEGKNILHIHATVLQVDKSIAQCSLDFPVTALTSTEDLPKSIDVEDFGTHSISVTIQPKK